MSYAIVLMHGDRSGIQQVWGPYITETNAKRALFVLKTWPIDGLWEIHKLVSYMRDEWSTDSGGGDG